MPVYKIFNPLEGQWKPPEIPRYLKKLYGILEFLIREVSYGVVVVVVIIIVVVVVAIVVVMLLAISAQAFFCLPGLNVVVTVGGAWSLSGLRGAWSLPWLQRRRRCSLL